MRLCESISRWKLLKVDRLNGKQQIEKESEKAVRRREINGKKCTVNLYCEKQTNSNSVVRFNINNSIMVSFFWRFFSSSNYNILFTTHVVYTSIRFIFSSFISLGSCFIFFNNNSNQITVYTFHNTLICIVYQIVCVKGRTTLKVFVVVVVGIILRCHCACEVEIPNAIIIRSTRVMLYSL